MGHFLQEKLGDYRIYQEQILWIHEKTRAMGKNLYLESEDIGFHEISRNSKAFAKAMVTDIKSGLYKTRPAKICSFLIKGKQRTIYKFTPTDIILHGVVSKVLNQYLEEKYSSNLHSYRRGRNYYQALSGFAKYAQKHYKAKVNPLERGLYVLRRDIANYTDTIPTSENSPLWDLLKKELQFPKCPSQSDLTAWDYLQRVIRSEISIPHILNEHNIVTPELGVPTGSPISSTMYNLYLINLDRKIDSLNLGFYCRYGDDLLLADESLELVLKADKTFNQTLECYKLESRKEKEKSLFLNAAGRISINPKASKFSGTQSVEFLGCQISSKGEISLHKKNEQELMKDLNQRLKKTLKQFESGSGSELNNELKLQLAIKIINKALDPDNKLCQKSALALRHVVTNRRYLQNLDYKLARLIIKHTLRYGSVKGFRHLRIKKLRQEGLMSLTASRNLVGKINK